MEKENLICLSFPSKEKKYYYKTTPRLPEEWVRWKQKDRFRHPKLPYDFLVFQRGGLDWWQSVEISD
jgi:hypothetical protein